VTAVLGVLRGCRRRPVGAAADKKARNNVVKETGKSKRAEAQGKEPYEEGHGETGVERGDVCNNLGVLVDVSSQHKIDLEG